MTKVMQAWRKALTLLISREEGPLKHNLMAKQKSWSDPKFQFGYEVPQWHNATVHHTVTILTRIRKRIWYSSRVFDTCSFHAPTSGSADCFPENLLLQNLLFPENLLLQSRWALLCLSQRYKQEQTQRWTADNTCQISRIRKKIKGMSYIYKRFMLGFFLKPLQINKAFFILLYLSEGKF